MCTCTFHRYTIPNKYLIYVFYSILFIFGIKRASLSKTSEWDNKILVGEGGRGEGGRGDFPQGSSSAGICHSSPPPPPSGKLVLPLASGREYKQVWLTVTISKLHLALGGLHRNDYSVIKVTFLWIDKHSTEYR